MRILETCIATWPVPEMQPRIDAFKEAFSADSSRPFELKRSFPYGSPSSSGTFQPSPPPDGHMNHPMLSHHDSHGRAADNTPNVSRLRHLKRKSYVISLNADDATATFATADLLNGCRVEPSTHIQVCICQKCILQTMLTARQFLEQCVWTASHRHGFSNSSHASAIISPSLSSFITIISHTFTSNASIVS